VVYAKCIGPESIPTTALEFFIIVANSKKVVLSLKSTPNPGYSKSVLAKLFFQILIAPTLPT
jgi:hypothetical protein